MIGQAVPERDEAGNVVAYIGAIIDITERKCAEETLQIESERLATTLRSIGDGVVATNADGQIILLNTIAEHLTGWSENEAKGLHIDDVFRIFDEKTGQPECEVIAAVLRDGIPAELSNHTVLVARDGTVRSIADSAAPVHNSEGGIVGAVIVFRDVTHFKQAERTLKLTQFAVDNAADMALWIDPDANILSTNKAACDALGYTLPELLALTVSDVNPDITRESWQGHWEDVKSAGAMTFHAQHEIQESVASPGRTFDQLLELRRRGVPIRERPRCLQEAHGGRSGQQEAQVRVYLVDGLDECFVSR